MKRIAKLLFYTTLVMVAAMTYIGRADSYSTNAVADAFVGTGPSGNLSGDNFGAAGSLTVEAGNLPQGEFQSVIKFDLSGAENYFNAEYGFGAWSVQSVSLQLTASAHGNAIFNPAAAGQFAVSLMGNNSWVEGTGTGGAPTTDGISYSSLQGVFVNNSTDQALGTFQFGGESSGTSTYGLGLTSGIIGDAQGGADVSLRLYAADSTVSYLFNSRMSPPTGPELIITAVPEPGTFELGAAGLAMFSLWKLPRRPRG